MMYNDDDFNPNGGGDDDGDDGFIPAQNPTKEDYDALVKKNRGLYARLKKGKKPQAKSDEAPSPKKEETPTPNDLDKQNEAWKEKIELKAEGYSDEEIDFLQRNGGRAKKDDPFVKAALESVRAQKKSEAAQVSDDTNKSDIEKKYTHEQLRDMPTAELEKILPKAQQ